MARGTLVCRTKYEGAKDQVTSYVMLVAGSMAFVETMNEFFRKVEFL
jgi:hypothetical protein